MADTAQAQRAAVKEHGSQAPPADETIHTTANHPWLTAGRGWVPAGDLHVGEAVVTLDGGTSTVATVRVVPGQVDYYNLTVANDHTYAVGDTQAVVHNTGADCTGDTYETPQQFAHERAHELQGLLSSDDAEHVTMASGVLEDSRGGRIAVIGTSEENGYVRPEVRGAVRPGEFVVPGNYHAEQNIVDFANDNGFKVIAVGAGRPISGDCAGAIFDAGGWDAVASPTRFSFTPFWMRQK
jgi:hypothetical protein